MLGAESGCLYCNAEVFQKYLEMCEIGKDSRLMLKHVSKIVGDFGEETLT